MINKFIKYSVYIIGTLVILGFVFIVIPWIVNKIIGTATPDSFTLYGKTENWHNFWAVYMGALIGAIVPFIILYKTLSNNKAENKENRELQIRTIEYQTQMQWINSLKTAVQQVYNAFNVLWLDEIYLLFKDTTEYNNSENYIIIKDKIKELCDRINNATDNFRLTIIGKNDSEEVKFNGEFDTLRLIYCNLVSDISALSRICFHNGTDDMLLSQFQRAIDEHKDKSTQTQDDSHRLWFIAKKYSMKLKSKKADIVKDLIDAYHPAFMYEWCKNVLQYETNKANSILNGTKQDK